MLFSLSPGMEMVWAWLCFDSHKEWRQQQRINNGPQHGPDRQMANWSVVWLQDKSTQSDLQEKNGC